MIIVLHSICVPISIIIIGFALRQTTAFDGLSKIAFLCGLISIVFVGVLVSDSLPQYAGLFQRIIEVTFIIWVIACAMRIKKGDQS